MAGAAQHRQEPGGQRREDGDALWVGAQQFLRLLHHHLKAARLLQRGRAADHGDDGEHHADWRFARLEAEDEHHEHQADAGDQAEAEPAVAGAQQQGAEDDQDLQDDGDHGCWVKH